MSLLGFQLALRDLIASPSLCLALRNTPESVLGNYELNSRERTRLLNVVHQRGMSVNCTLYRVNRVTPIYTLLTMTCHLLGDNLRREMDAFWISNEATTLQFKHEIHQFSAFIYRRLSEGILTNPYLEEVLNFEQAINMIQYLPRIEILALLAAYRSPLTPNIELRLHPLARLIRFMHNPVILLPALMDLTEPPSDIEVGDYTLLIDARLPDLEIRVLSADISAALRMVVSERHLLNLDEFMQAVSNGLIVSSVAYDQAMQLHYAVE